ncbi:MAG: prohead protease/major capsid protein fusion protein [Thiohalorhabdus sp.]
MTGQRRGEQQADQRTVQPLAFRGEFSPESANNDERTVDVVWSTGARVLRRRLFEEPFYEELSMEPDAVRMGRLENGAPVIDSHMAFGVRDMLGVTENARLSNGEGLATLRISQREELEGLWQDIRDGIVNAVSIGYRVYQYVESGRTEEGTLIMRAVDWEPFEISLVPVGADPDAGIRSEERHLEPNPVEIHRATQKGAPMTTKKQGQQGAGNAPEGEETRNQPEGQTEPSEPQPAAAGTEGARGGDGGGQSASAAGGEGTKDAETIRREAQEAERQRVNEIRKACRSARVGQELEDQLIRDGVSVDEARAKIIDDWSERVEGGVDTDNHIRTPLGGQDEQTQVREAASIALLHRFQPGKYKLENGAEDFRGLSLLEMARATLERRGVSTRGLSKMEVAERAFHSVDDFPEILANATNKTLRDAYDTAPRTFTLWARQNTASDFKEVARAQLGEAPQLKSVKENGEFEYGTMGEAAEKYALSTYGRIIAITRQAIVNDDLDAFMRIASAFGRSAAHKESDIVYGVINTNAKMADGTALFHSDHGNLASSGGAISVDTLGAGRAAMRKQKGIDGETLLNVVPSYLLVPAAIETEADQYIAQNYDPDSPGNINPFGGSLTKVAEPRLDEESESAWYLAADSGDIDTIEYAYLDGEEGVVTEERMGFNVDGMEIKARLDFAAKAIDWRGLYKNPGA